MQFTSAEAEHRYAALVAQAADTVIGLDFDGVLAPIVDDPDAALIHPDAPDLLVELAEVVRAVAVITGRPTRQALVLGGLDDVGSRIDAAGRQFFVLGQYGNERWTARDRRVVSPRPPQGLASFSRDLPALLRRHDASSAHLEEKGLAVAVHTRRMADPSDAFARLLPELTALAEQNGLAVEPGRHVIEVRAPGQDKGAAVRGLSAELDAGGFLFAGDDLGDVAAFEAVAELRDAGRATLLVCSASEEQQALVDLADVVVDGPSGVLALLRRLVDDVRAL